MYMAAAIFISPLGGMLSNIIGRRKCFIILTFVGILGYITIALSPNIPTLFVGRSLTIVSASGLSATVGTLIFFQIDPSFSLTVDNTIFFIAYIRIWNRLENSFTTKCISGRTVGNIVSIL